MLYSNEIVDYLLNSKMSDQKGLAKEVLKMVGYCLIYSTLILLFVPYPIDLNAVKFD